MCGRLNVTDDPWVIDLIEELGIPLDIKPNPDLRPTQEVATVAAPEGELRRLDTTWGIKPSWAKKLLINAQAETVATKPTFRQAFAERRCLVPCSGFYEWRDEGGRHKRKYLFSGARSQGLLMAAIWYPAEIPQIVTLTRDAPPEFAEYHYRFPVFVPLEGVRDWILADPESAGRWMTAAGGQGIVVEAA